MGTILILAPPYAPVGGRTDVAARRALRIAVGDAHVLTDPDVVAGQVRDWTGRFSGSTPAVVRPGTVDEVAAVLRACGDAGAAVVPQGGNTGLVGGSVPLHGEVVLDLRRLDALGPVDVARRAGHRAGRRDASPACTSTRTPPVGTTASTSSARDTATVGGTVATNAGGMHVLRYGATRRQVLGVEAVFADGRVMRRLDGLEKDNTGYDLSGLLCGSEGTLAVITAARLRLVPRPTHVVVALLAFDDVDAALDAVGELRRALDSLRAVELFFQRRPRPRVRAARRRPAVRGPPRRVRAGRGRGPYRPDRRARRRRSTRFAGVADVAVATDDRAARDLWRYREGHTEAINLLGAPHKLDVTLPADELARFVSEVREQVTAVASARAGLAVRTRGRRQHSRERDGCCS